ncbi:hypothetical protein [Paenibacillus sp. O199]|uniref:hypothetical protein n=1 Tax=Paenibacillus sp. O199 TaxID=1643925 RepID=UPI0007BFD74C|nr:hypothetical protein [Paenibacillus sp. O199]
MIQKEEIDELAALRLAMRFTVEFIKKHDRQYKDLVYLDLLHKGLSLMPDTDVCRKAFQIIDNDGIYPDEDYYEKQHIDVLNERPIDQITSVFTAGTKRSKRHYYMTSFDIPNPNGEYPKYLQKVTMYNLFQVNKRYVKEKVFTETVQGMDKIDGLVLEHLNLGSMKKVGSILWMEMLRGQNREGRINERKRF